MVGIVNQQRRPFRINLTEFENSSPGFGEFLYEPDWLNMEDAERAVTFFYHLALCALNTSLVSGAMAERCPFHSSSLFNSYHLFCRVNFKTFLVYSLFNVIIYAIPASWLFSQDGWLKQLGGIDYGCGVVQTSSFLEQFFSFTYFLRWCILWEAFLPWWSRPT